MSEVRKNIKNKEISYKIIEVFNPQWEDIRYVLRNVFREQCKNELKKLYLHNWFIIIKKIY